MKPIFGALIALAIWYVFVAWVAYDINWLVGAADWKPTGRFIVGIFSFGVAIGGAILSNRSPNACSKTSLKERDFRNLAVR